ncbi:CRISPR-associated helicase Cas3' [Gaoshiqia sediminis]|uniref:CRISPR-associated helicase Cas3 n=1 Tax=Gaoshiqia sediminis TaxID=2986998 RepID=A0AA41Y9M6_9BACT|nr:CRISPR-associated helicase Cas3' [Gaoshiqia sediminis]MCW0484166.1 CRISPR-associated helicase Cas3' [Gaoshiqia sediminis]
MTELRSHPDKYLIDHLREVATIATCLVSDKGYRFVLANGAGITQQQLTDLVWIAGAFHDLAKATSYFQAYIREPEGVHSHLKNHAQLSSIFTWFVASRYCKQQFSDKLLSELIPTLVLIAVKRHHGNIENLEKELSFSNDDLENFSEQIRSIDNESIELIISELLVNCKVKTSWKEFTAYWQGNTFQQEMKDFKIMSFKFRYPKFDEPSRITLFNLFQVIYSALMFADKNDVILDETRFDQKQTNITKRLGQFREKKGFNIAQTEIDRLKNEAYFNTLEHLEKVFKPEQHLYSITLPTGLGKTLTAYAVADKLRELSGNADAKIVINIPFTSIIDQNFDVYRQVLGTDSSDVLLKHHHLAEPNYKDGSEKVYDFDKSQFLIETWQSETIVTTFVQFLETILSMDKTKLMKLAHLRNAVVLLDEIQTIPYELWETIRKSFLSLGESLNMYFVLISATQPLIFTPGENITELVPNYQKYFKVFNRTRLHYHAEAVSFDSFVESVSNYVCEEPEKDVLVIMNTKKAARTCFEQLVNLDLDDTDYYFLSTLITPYERKEIIRKIRKKNGNRKLIISTQLIEAGVDISVDTIFRQLSPIDSIIQSAGRANRYNEKKTISDIFLFEIDGEHQRTTSRIYGSDLILKTKNVLKDFNDIEESNYLKLIECYFEEVRKQSDETSSTLLDAILGLRFAEIGLSLIEERKSDSVFIQLNEEAKAVWEQYVSLYRAEGLTPWELKARFSAFKSTFYDYVINVPVPYGETKINFDSEQLFGFYLSNLEQQSLFYSYSATDSTLNTGYNTNKQLVSI